MGLQQLKMGTEDVRLVVNAQNSPSIAGSMWFGKVIAEHPLPGFIGGSSLNHRSASGVGRGAQSESSIHMQQLIGIEGFPCCHEDHCVMISGSNF